MDRERINKILKQKLEQFLSYLSTPGKIKDDQLFADNFFKDHFKADLLNNWSAFQGKSFEILSLKPAKDWVSKGEAIIKVAGKPETLIYIKLAPEPVEPFRIIELEFLVIDALAPKVQAFIDWLNREISKNSLPQKINCPMALNQYTYSVLLTAWISVGGAQEIQVIQNHDNRLTLKINGKLFDALLRFDYLNDGANGELVAV